MDGLKTEYDYIEFVRRDSEPPAWGCFNKKHGDELGEVRFEEPWRQYCYYPLVFAVYSAKCLTDISDFLGQLQRLPIGASDFL